MTAPMSETRFRGKDLDAQFTTAFEVKFEEKRVA
jgi:hypothetical protein